MINPNGSLFVLDGQMKCFSFSPTEDEQQSLKSLLSKVKRNFPEKARISLNFFRDGDNYHGEALVGYDSQCYIARTLGVSVPEVAEKLTKKIVAKKK